MGGKVYFTGKNTVYGGETGNCLRPDDSESLPRKETMRIFSEVVAC